MVRSLHAAQLKPRNVLPSRPRGGRCKLCPSWSPGEGGGGGDDIQRQNGKRCYSHPPKANFPVPLSAIEKCGRKKGLWSSCIFSNTSGAALPCSGIKLAIIQDLG